MTPRRMFVVAALLAAAAAPGFGQSLADTQLFAVISATPGLGTPPTQWVSDVTVHNPNEGAVTVGFQFFPERQANVLDPTFSGANSFVLELAPGETRSLENIIPASFGITTAIKGMLLVSCSSSFFPSNDESDKLVATSRTYNVGSAAGTFGQTVGSNFELFNVYDTPSIVTGARQDRRFRSNLGVATIAMGGPITIHYRIRGADGGTIAQGTKVLQPLSMAQWSFASLGVDNTDQPLTVEVWLDPADVTPDPCNVADQGGIPNAITAYVSKVDGNPDGTGDAEFIAAVPTGTLDCLNR